MESGTEVTAEDNHSGARSIPNRTGRYVHGRGDGGEAEGARRIAGDRRRLRVAAAAPVRGRRRPGRRDARTGRCPTGRRSRAYLRQGQSGWRRVDPALAGASARTSSSSRRDRTRWTTWSRCATAHPGLVVVSITPFGLDGPVPRPARERPHGPGRERRARGARHRRPGADPDGRAAPRSGWAARTPPRPRSRTWRRRRAGGAGALVDVSLAEVAYIGAANFMDVFLAVEHGPDAEPTGIVPPHASRRRRSSAPPTAGSGSTRTRRTRSTGFLRMIGRDDLADSGEFMMVGSRLGRRDEWQAMVDRLDRRRGRTAEIIERGRRAQRAGRAGVQRPDGGRARPGRRARQPRPVARRHAS